MLTEKESGLYFESGIEFITEREYIKEWCEEIIGNSGDEFYEKHGFDYDLDDDEVYEDFLHLNHEQVDKNRKDGLTINLNTGDLQKSIITTRHSDEKIKFEDLGFSNTEQVLKALDIKYLIKEPSLSDLMDELEDDEYVYAENNVQDYLIYIDKNELVVKSSESNTPFTLKEFIEYNSDRLKHSPDGIDKDLVKATRELYTSKTISDSLLSKFGAEALINTSNMKAINIDKSTDQYALFEMKYADSSKAMNKVMNEDTFYIMEDIVYTGLERTKKKGVLHFKFTLEGDNEMTLDETSFTDLVIDQYNNELLEKSKEKLESAYGVNFCNIKKEDDSIIASFTIPKHKSSFDFKLNKDSTFTIDNISAFEDVVDNADSSLKPSDEDLTSTLKTFVETKAKLEQKTLLEEAPKLQQEKPSKKKKSSLRI